jgi:protein gp37
MSKIEWTERTWNPITGCTKVSQGCKFCYAERMALRLQAMGQPNYANGFTLTLHPHMLDIPLKRKKPTMWFVNSMSDLFHEDVPFTFIDRIFDVIGQTPHHTYQILTKRPERMVAYAVHRGEWPANAWAGTSIENFRVSVRLIYLRQVPAKVRFLSCEPLLGSLAPLDLLGVHWVIVGGESGPGARPMDAQWAREIRNKCVHHSIPFFFKQWGGVNKKATGRVLDGRTWNEMPLTGESAPTSARVAQSGDIAPSE